MRTDKASMVRRSFRRAIKYEFFAPLQALWLAFTRPGGYFKHLLGLYRLSRWKGWNQS